MFATIFAFAFITVYVTAEIPSYIDVCGRRDPKLEQCILNNIENLKDKICEGMPELDIQPNDPLFLDKLVIFDTPTIKLSIKDSQLTGLCDFVINFFHMDIDGLHFDVDLLFNRIHINATYNLNMRLLVPIAIKGQVYISTNNVGTKVGVDMKLITKGDKQYVFMSKMKTNLDVKKYDIQFGLNQTNISQLREIVRNFIGNNQGEILQSFKPVLEEAISKRIIMVSNDIFKHFTYEELFPDRI